LSFASSSSFFKKIFLLTLKLQLFDWRCVLDYLIILKKSGEFFLMRSEGITIITGLENQSKTKK